MDTDYKIRPNMQVLTTLIRGAIRATTLSEHQKKLVLSIIEDSIRAWV
jgi:hypothetical protein